MTDNLNQLLEQYFGFTRFLPGQAEAVGHLLAGRSVAAVFPAGGGKSLCFQLPALLSECGLLVIDEATGNYVPVPWFALNTDGLWQQVT